MNSSLKLVLVVYMRPSDLTAIPSKLEAVQSVVLLSSTLSVILLVKRVLLKLLKFFLKVYS